MNGPKLNVVFRLNFLSWLSSCVLNLFYQHLTSQHFIFNINSHNNGIYLYFPYTSIYYSKMYYNQILSPSLKKIPVDWNMKFDAI